MNVKKYWQNSNQELNYKFVFLATFTGDAENSWEQINNISSN